MAKFRKYIIRTFLVENPDTGREKSFCNSDSEWKLFWLPLSIPIFTTAARRLSVVRMSRSLSVCVFVLSPRIVTLSRISLKGMSSKYLLQTPKMDPTLKMKMTPKMKTPQKCLMFNKYPCIHTHAIGWNMRSEIFSCMHDFCFVCACLCTEVHEIFLVFHYYLS